MLQLAKKDNDQTITMKVGQTLEVALSSNPTTGYEWAVVSNNPGVLATMGAATYDAATTERAGAATTQRLRFRTVRTGRVLLELAYKRPWEKSPKDAETWKVKVLVGK